MADGKMAKVRIMMADDHEVVRSGLKAILEPEGEFDVVGEAVSGEEAIAQVAAHRPGVVLMDVRMEEMSRIETCRAIKSAHPEVNVLMLTSYSEEEAVTAAIIAGASAYLLKNVGRSELIKAIRGVAAGQNLLDPAGDGETGPAKRTRGGPGSGRTVPTGKGGYGPHRGRSHQPRDCRAIGDYRKHRKKPCKPHSG